MSAYSDLKGDDGKKQALITAAKAELEKLKALKTWLGFSLYRREGDTVMRVKGVLPASPAVAAGLSDDTALYKAKGVSIGSIADFAAQIKGSQVGDKIELEIDRNGSNQNVTLIVGTQAAPIPFVHNVVRIAVDNEVRDSDYEISELKPAVDEWVSKNASVLEEARKKEEEQRKAAEEEQRKKDEEQKKAEEERQKKEAEEKAKAAAATAKPAPTAATPTAATPTAAGGKKYGCKFGFRPHTDKWKKDICLMCGQTKAAHEEGYVPPEPSPKPTAQADKKKEEEEKARKEQEEREAREREEAEKRQREEEERKKKEIEEQEAKVKEELDRIAREEAALKEAEAKLASDEAARKKEEEEKAAAAAATSPKPATPAATTSAPRGGKKCPFGFRPDPNPRKKGICSICGRTEAEHAADAAGVTSPTTSSPAPTNAAAATSPPATGGVAKAWSPFLQKQFEEKQKKEAERLKIEEALRAKREEEERKKKEEEEKLKREEEERLKREEEERLKREEEERLKREEEERLKREEEERLKREEEERIKREEEEKKAKEEEAKKKAVEEEEKRKAAWASASPSKNTALVGSRTRPKCPFGFKPDSNPRKKGICAVCGLTEAEHAKK